MPPQDISLSGGNDTDGVKWAEENVDAQFTCIVEKVKPLVKIQWKKGDDNPEDSSREISNCSDTSHRISSTWTTKFERNENNKERVTCLILSDDGREELEEEEKEIEIYCKLLKS